MLHTDEIEYEIIGNLIPAQNWFAQTSLQKGTERSYERIVLFGQIRVTRAKDMKDRSEDWEPYECVIGFISGAVFGIEPVGYAEDPEFDSFYTHRSEMTPRQLEQIAY